LALRLTLAGNHWVSVEPHRQARARYISDAYPRQAAYARQIDLCLHEARNVTSDFNLQPLDSAHASQGEQALKVICGLLSQLLKAHAAQQRQVLSHITHIFRHIWLTTVRHRGEVRCVGFHQ
jgi:hypothetical protein